jgi:hypothetical protein
MVLFGCAADVGSESNSEDESAELGSSSEALSIGGGGLGVASCPGGGLPMCVVCDNGCKTACYGGYTCNTEPSVCSYTHNCRTSGGGIRGDIGGVLLRP